MSREDDYFFSVFSVPVGAFGSAVAPVLSLFSVSLSFAGGELAGTPDPRP
jgi:hypothetical protein